MNEKGSIILRGDALTSRGEDDEHCREQIDQQRSEVMKEDQRRTVDVQPTRVRHHAPRSFFFLVDEQAKMKDLRNEETDDEQTETGDDPFRPFFAFLLVETDALKDGHRSFDRHEGVQPVVHVDDDLQQRFDSQTIGVENDLLSERRLMREKEKPVFQDEQHHGKDGIDRRSEEIHSAPEFLRLRSNERQDRKETIDRADQKQQQGDQRADLHSEGLIDESRRSANFIT